MFKAALGFSHSFQAVHWVLLPGGGTDLEREYGYVRPWRPPFQASPVVRKGPISSKNASSQDPFWENLEILASTSSIFAQSLAHKPPNLEISISQAPNFEKFSAHKSSILEINSSQAPSLRGKYQVASPTLRKSGPHTPTWKKKLSAPPLVFSHSLACSNAFYAFYTHKGQT